MTAVVTTIDPGDRLAKVRARRARGTGHLHGQWRKCCYGSKCGRFSAGSFKQPEEFPQTQVVTPVILLEMRIKLDKHLDDNVYPAVCVISNTTMTDQLRSSEGPNEPGHNLSNAEVRTCKQSWTSEKHAACVMRVTSSAIGPEILSAQAALLT